MPLLPTPGSGPVRDLYFLLSEVWGSLHYFAYCGFGDINIAFVLRILAITLCLSHHSRQFFRSIFMRLVRCRIQGSEQNNLASYLQKGPKAQHDVDRGRSLIYRRKRRGPRIDP